MFFNESMVRVLPVPGLNVSQSLERASKNKFLKVFDNFFCLVEYFSGPKFLLSKLIFDEQIF